NDALGDGGSGGEEGAGDFFGGEAADFAERERGASVGREGGVAACEDETKAIVFDGVVVGIGGGSGLIVNAFGHLGKGGIVARPAADGVDAFEAAGGNEPGARVRGDAIARPLLGGRCERIVKSFFGQVEVAEQADERGEDAAGFGAVDGVYGSAGLGVGGVHGDLLCFSLSCALPLW